MTGNMTGKVFNNRYQITERIGIGGMAEVYRAQDNVLGRLVAVKVMLPQYAADPNFTKRFKQEAAAAANLQSPYIVNVYDWGQDDGTYYIVMEFVRGSDLKTAINERGAINQRKVAEIGSQVCQALSVAYGLDIIHRDIKPQNIMVQPDGNVKVMDFGIARAKNSVMTQTSSVLGTAHYISPEQAQGKELTAASDMYSLGIVMYEAATGRLPFDGPDAVSVAMKQVNELPAPPREINPDIDPALEAIIMRAMAKNPSERFATAQDMRYALNDYLAGRPVNVGNAGNFTSAETAVMGGVVPPMAVADGTAVMPAMGKGGVKPAVSSSGSKNYRNDNNAPKGSKKTLFIVLGILAALIVVGGIAFALMSGLGASGDPVPDLKGMTQEQAEAKLKEQGFQLGSVDQKYDEAEAGKIIGQDPKAGDKREKGTKVNITVSQGAQQIAVPDLKNMTVDDAKKLLIEKGLVPSAGTPKSSDDVEKGKVMGQSPEAGSKVEKGATVEYYQSLGPEGTDVPSVVGSMEGEAVATLQNAGFKVTTDYTSSDSVESGLVISQSPNAKQKLKPGETVNIVVSTGKQATYYNVNLNANGGGTVNASSFSVEEGDSVRITIMPDPGYIVASVIGLDGVPQSGGTFTVPNVKNDVNITVTFQQSTPTTPDPPDDEKTPTTN